MPEQTDVIDLITADHRAVERLFAKLEADSTPDEQKAQLLQEVAAELIPHSKAEEDVVYPAIEAAAPRTDDEVHDGVAEHHHVEELLTQLLGMPVDAPGADGILAAVIGEVRHHVEEEEQDILPAYKKASSPEERARIGAEFMTRKNDARTAMGLGPVEMTIDLTEATKDELYERAKQQDLPGRSQMTKEELAQALEGR